MTESISLLDQNSVKKNSFINLYVFLFLFFIQLEFSKTGIFFVIILDFILIINNRFLFNKILLNLLSSLLFIIIICIFSGSPNFFIDSNRYFKDLLLFTQPVLIIILGYYFIGKEISFFNFVKLLILSTSAVSLYKIIFYLQNNGFNIKPIFYLILTDDIKWYNFSQIFVFLLVSFAIKYNIKFFKPFVLYFILLFSVICILFSISRTTYICFFVILFILFAKKRYLIHFNKYVIFYSVFVMFTIFGSNYINVKQNNLNKVSIESKISNSLNEVLITNNYSKSSIIYNYRSYEAWLGINKFNNGNFLNNLFGFGLGSKVLRPPWIFPLNSSYLDNIPYFHNGYVTLLFKSGILGFLFFFIFILKISKIALDLLENNDILSLFFSKLLFILLLILLISTYVIHGIYKPGLDYFFPFILIGYSIKRYILFKCKFQ
jgi:hypothetical protein